MLKRLFLSEKNMMTAILLNAIVICMMYFPAFKHKLWLELIDELFILLFTVEAVVKIQAYRPKGYFGNWWNRFDFIIVVASLPTLLVHFVEIPNTSLLMVLRMFRLVRFIRFVRFIQFVPNLSKILDGLGRALKASVFVIVALVFFDFILAIFSCHFFAEVAPQYFGDPLISAYSIFQMFTVEGWNEIPAAIAKKVENPFILGVSRLYFLLIVLIGGIFGMSLANAVFVDEMTMDNNEALETKIDTLQREIAELKELIRNKE